jgi:hypothetical protein
MSDDERYITRYCDTCGVFQNRRDVDNGRCWRCKKECEEIENLAELRNKFSSQI